MKIWTMTDAESEILLQLLQIEQVECRHLIEFETQWLENYEVQEVAKRLESIDEMLERLEEVL